MPKGLVRFPKTGAFHFLTFSCHQRLPLLASRHGYGVFENELETVRQRFGLVIAGYVLMPEHVHLLMGESRTEPLAKVIQVLKKQTSILLKSPGTPHFWLPRYYDFGVWSHEKCVEKLRYMHRNPVKRGLVAKPEDWPWSSFRHYATGEEGTVEIESDWTSRRRELRTGSPTHPSAFGPTHTPNTRRPARGLAVLRSVEGKVNPSELGFYPAK